MTKKYTGYRGELDRIAGEGRLRHIPADGLAFGTVDMVSNDYMGIAENGSSLPLCWDGLPDELRAAYESLCGPRGEKRSTLLEKDWMWSASASRLLSTRQLIPNLLEKVLEADYRRPALLFNSGYHANVGCIGALNIPGTLFITDKLMHASAYDGLAAARCKVERFPHNDIDRLQRLISRHGDEAERIVVITESVFSMDGDRAPLKELAVLRKENEKVLLYVDEAHGYGCFGPHGLGLAMEEGVAEDIDILIGTFGKAGGSAGAFAIAPAPLHQLLVNRARSFIFSTSLPPAVILRSLENHLRLRGADDRRERLAEISAEVRECVTRLIGPTPSTTHIIPMITGSAESAIALATKLRDAGITALPIRRPTVPPGAERVRLSLSALLTREITEIFVNLSL